MRLQIPFRLAGLAIIIFSEFTYAADAPLGGYLPGSILPEQVSKSLSQPTTETTTPQVLPPIAPEAEGESTPLGEQAKQIKFKLNKVIVEGNHIYSTAELSPIFKAKQGKVITVADLFSIVQGITNYYRNNGYIITRAILPPQHVKEGTVKIQVIEGFIGKVDIGGEPQGVKCFVNKVGQHIKENPPLQIAHMEKYLLIANEIPGTQVRAVMSPSTDKTGAADLTLMTELKTVSGYFSYDNYGTRYIGPQQITGNVSFNSLFGAGDATQFTFTKTPKGGELTYMDLNYNSPVGTRGIRAATGITRAHTRPLFVLEPVKIDGLTTNIYTNFTFPYIRTRSESLTFRAGFNYLDSEVNIMDEPLYLDHIRSLDLGVTYNFADRFYGANMISSDFRVGLPFLGYTSNQNPDTAMTSRPGGRGDYAKVAAQASRIQAIKGAWSAYGAISGQWAFNPLLASEQFTFGGSQMGRGYDVAEIIGDKGLGGSLELRYDLGIGKYLIQSLQFYAFYDAGIAWSFKQVGDTPRRVSATSTGIGMRFYLSKYISGNIMYTQPLTKEVAAESIIKQGRTPRIFFSIVANV